MALILWLDRGRIRLASLAAALLPYIVVGGLWGMYLMQDFQAVREQLQVNTTDRWATTLNPVVILGNELGRYWQTYGLVTGGINSIKVLGLALNVMGVVGCLWVRDLRRQPTVRFLLIQLGLYFLGLSLFNQKLSIYLVHIAPFYAILAAVWLEWLAEHRARWRPLIAIAIAGLILIETGGIVLKSYTRSYVAGQRALVSFIRSQARPDDHIAGTASLLFEMQFDSRLKDDPYLGTQSGRVPDIIVVEQLYQMLYDGWKTQRAEDMQPVMARFEDYRVAYQKDGYAVWLRKDR
ncbi:MAG: hypothetical protein ABI811_18555 [Acidobacteriota bacterium]